MKMRPNQSFHRTAAPLLNSVVEDVEKVPVGWFFKASHSSSPKLGLDFFYSLVSVPIIVGGHIWLNQVYT